MGIQFVAVLPDWMTDFYIATKVLSWFMLFIEMPAFLLLGFGFDWSPFADTHFTSVQFMALFFGQAVAFLFACVLLVYWVYVASERSFRREMAAHAAKCQAQKA